MPRKVFKHSNLTGWTNILLYDELEMSHALNLTPDELRREVEGGVLAVYRLAVDGSYEFDTTTYLANLRAWTTVLESR